MTLVQKDNDILYIVMPAYNEAENIEAAIEEWYEIVRLHCGGGKSRLLVINDGSTDDTEIKAKRLCDDKPLLRVITKENGGHGSAVMYGYKTALEAGAEYIFQTDSDRQATPAEFEGFWRQRERFDVIIGNRFMREDGASRIFVSKTETVLLAAFMHVHVKDANAPYRLMSAYALNNAIKYLDDDECIPNMMLAAVFKRLQLHVLYKDITFKARSAGHNSLNIKKISKMGIDALKRMIKIDERLKENRL